MASALRLVAKGRRLVVVQLLAANHGVWCCKAIASAVWVNVGRWRLRQRQQDDDLACSGSRRAVSAWLDPPGVVQRRKTAQATSLVYWLDGGDFVLGGSNRMLSSQGGGLAIWYDLGGGASHLATLTAIQETSLERGAVWRVVSPHARVCPTADEARPPRVWFARARCFHPVG